MLLFLCGTLVVHTFRNYIPLTGDQPPVGPFCSTKDPLWNTRRAPTRRVTPYPLMWAGPSEPEICDPVNFDDSKIHQNSPQVPPSISTQTRCETSVTP